MLWVSFPVENIVCVRVVSFLLWLRALSLVFFFSLNSQDGPDAPQVDEDGFCIRPENPMDSILLTVVIV